MPPDALDHISIAGFKSIASIDKLPLRAVNLLIGANGSGKSNFIEVFGLLDAIRHGRLQNYVAAASGAERLLHFGSKRTKQIEIGLSFRSGINRYAITLAPAADDSLYVAEEAAFFRRSGTNAEKIEKLGGSSDRREAGISRADLRAVPTWVRNRLAGWRVYHPFDTSSSSPMRKTAKVDDNEFLRADGSNLAAFLYYLRQKHESSYALIRGTIGQVAPFFDDFQLEPRKLQPDDIRLEWRHKTSPLYFDAASLSDGTLRFIALATLFLQPVHLRPSVLIVDEPELGLHPYAVGVLASLIRQASVDRQVVIATQSPQLLDYFEPEDVLVASRQSGSTRITRLESRRLAKWLQEYSLGQLWEKNEIGGRPVRE